MRRVTLLLLVVLALGAGVAWIAERPGGVVIDWQGWRVEASIAALLGLLLLLVLAGMLLQWIWGWLVRAMPFVGADRHLQRQRRGLAALNQAVIALAAGDAAAAQRLSARARRLLPPQPVTHVLAAQAARLAGDEKAVEAEYRALLEDPAAAFLGLRGLLANAIRAGRPREALRLAREARDKDPKSPWAIRTVFALEVRAAHWPAAEATLDDARRGGVFDGDEIKRHKCALLFCRAQEEALAGHGDAAEKQLKAALRQRKDFTPAIAQLARLHLAAGDRKKAARVIERGWALAPHPELADVFAAFDPMERASERYRRFSRLAKGNRNSAESRLTLAEKALAADHYREAETLVHEVLETETPARAFRILAAAARARGGDDGERDAREWDEKARGGQPGRRWVCGQCGASHGGVSYGGEGQGSADQGNAGQGNAVENRWTSHCHNCQAFNSLNWVRPGDGPPQGTGIGSGVPGDGPGEVMGIWQSGNALNVALLPDSLAGTLPPPPDIDPGDPGHARREPGKDQGPDS